MTERVLTPAEKATKRAEALRANLARRKTQMRGRAQADGTTQTANHTPTKNSGEE